MYCKHINLSFTQRGVFRRGHYMTEQTIFMCILIIFWQVSQGQQLKYTYRVQYLKYKIKIFTDSFCKITKKLSEKRSVLLYTL